MSVALSLIPLCTFTAFTISTSRLLCACGRDRGLQKQLDGALCACGKDRGLQEQLDGTLCACGRDWGLQEQLDGAQSRSVSFVKEKNLLLLSGFEPCSLPSIPTELSRLRSKSGLQ